VTNRESAEEFWSRPDLVAAYREAGSALAYEVDAVQAATDAARRSGPVDAVHVLGVGGGRELGEIRRVTGARMIHAWDISEPMVQTCREHVRVNGWDDVVVGRAAIDELQRPDGEAADVVVALGAVLGYATDAAAREQAMAVIAGLLRPGGALTAVVQQRHGRPDWSLYFAARSLLERTPLLHDGQGNRRSRHGDGSVLFHHYDAPELSRLAAGAGFDDVRVTSLRSWARDHGARLPRRSPNPLILHAVAATR
jgi:SAM-dependent methyltransferase